MRGDSLAARQIKVVSLDVHTTALLLVSAYILSSGHLVVLELCLVILSE